MKEARGQKNRGTYSKILCKNVFFNVVSQFLLSYLIKLFGDFCIFNFNSNVPNFAVNFKKQLNLETS